MEHFRSQYIEYGLMYIRASRTAQPGWKWGWGRLPSFPRRGGGFSPHKTFDLSSLPHNLSSHNLHRNSKKQPTTTHQKHLYSGTRTI